MMTRCPTQWRLLMILTIVAQLLVSIHSSSISSTKGDQQQRSTISQQQQQFHQTPSTTGSPILLTTISQDGEKTKQQQPSPHQKYNNIEGTKQRSNPDEHEEMPLATINNHSRNNQAALKPPQYVDVSALVGSRNSSNAFGGSTTSTNMNSNSIMPNSMLSPKSRSGLPECATQQVCNAIFVRMNHTQRLCECSSNYNWKCSSNLDPQDGHTIELTRKFDKRIYTQIKTCEPLREVRACKSPTDWTLLALQSERSGKAHYVVVCKCPTWAQLEGPYTHNHPPYANIPAYAAYNPALSIYPEFPWPEALNVLNTTNLANNLNSPH